MSIKLDNFVTVNIDYETETNVSGARPNVIFLDKDNESGSSLVSNSQYTSFSDFPAGSDTLKDGVYSFFANGGKSFTYLNYTSGTGEPLATIKSLYNQNVVIILSTNDLTNAISLVTTINETCKGINEKLFIIDLPTTAIPAASTTIAEVPNLIVKFGVHLFSAFSTAAYLSQIDPERGSIQDYCFTRETLVDSTGQEKSGACITDDATFKSIKDFNVFNCDIELVGDKVNYGGNTLGKLDLVNYYVKIILTQTLTGRLVNVLKNKLRYNQVGLSIISANIVAELNKYRRFGYLADDKVWEGPDVYDSSNTYKLLSKNTLLNLGYNFTILPFSSLEPTEKSEHQLPDIYIFLADSYGIRGINIIGKVF